MKLIRYNSLRQDYEEVHEQKVVDKTDWTGKVIGKKVIVSPEVIGKKEYYNEYVMSLDGVWRLHHDSKRNVDFYFINDLLTTKECYERVLKELEEA